MQARALFFTVTLAINTLSLAAAKSVQQRELQEIERTEAYEKSAWRLEQIKTIVVSIAAIASTYILWRFLRQQNDMSAHSEQVKQKEEELISLRSQLEREQREHAQTRQYCEQAYGATQVSRAAAAQAGKTAYDLSRIVHMKGGEQERLAQYTLARLEVPLRDFIRAEIARYCSEREGAASETGAGASSSAPPAQEPPQQKRWLSSWFGRGTSDPQQAAEESGSEDTHSHRAESTITTPQGSEESSGAFSSPAAMGGPSKSLDAVEHK